MIQCICPECGLRADLEVFLGAGDFSRALAAALEMPAPLASLVIRYLRLFSPPQKALAQRKAARLLTELAEAIRSAEIRWHHQTWAAPVELWRHAIEQVIDHPPQHLPLTTHRYLYAVVAHLAMQAARKEEQMIENTKQQRSITKARNPLELNHMLNELKTLKLLEQANPGMHTDAIARLEAAIAAYKKEQVREKE